MLKICTKMASTKFQVRLKFLNSYTVSTLYRGPLQISENLVARVGHIHEPTPSVITSKREAALKAKHLSYHFGS